MNMIDKVVQVFAPLLKDSSFQHTVNPVRIDRTIECGSVVFEAKYPPLKSHERECWEAKFWYQGKNPNIRYRPAVIKNDFGLHLALCRVHDLATNEVYDDLGRMYAQQDVAIEEAIALMHELDRF